MCIAQRWHRNLFWRFRKFRVSDYSFRNLIRNSKPQPKPETSTETRNLNRNPEIAKTSVIYLFILSKVGAAILCAKSESFGIRNITSETLFETRNLTRHPKPHSKPETSPERQKLPKLPHTFIALMY